MKRILFFCLLFLTVHAASAQKFILLQKGDNQKTRLKFEVGEEFVYKTAQYDFFITEVIRDITIDAIILTDNVIQPSQIVAVDIRKKDPRNYTLDNLSYLGMGGGAMLLLASSINSLYQEGDFSLSGGTLGLSAGLIGTGLLIRQLKYKTFKHKGRNKIQLVILYEE
ncbi:hypothetical protein [Mongoliitalea daihaiensis]|uniref:hypothetical protein n=1 Tax=Mongoliitalea daihaiensis TaxID=2782006 RepID=UPI001F226691|nr:hypothetical protein [Mongoliitalea daihaiensis]UJP64808.1 hypothetical protein IPZ59_18770 [Mongoliitalea daihaiensis]